MPQPPAAPPVRPEPAPVAGLTSARQALHTLDKAVRALRTYGAANALSVRFFDQLFAEVTEHLVNHGTLGFTVRRDALTLLDETVFAAEESGAESLPARLHADGIREVAFQPALTTRDLKAFLHALAGGPAAAPAPEGAPAPDDEDDDIVTRLWAQGLATITFVTAEEVAQAPWLATVLTPQERGFFAAPPATFRDVVARERAAGPGKGLPGGAGAGVVGFEVSEAELAGLRAELDQERATDPVQRVLAIYKAILRTERDAALLARALGAVPGLFDALLREARWGEVVDLAEDVRSTVLLYDAYEAQHRVLATRMIASLQGAEHLRHMSAGLARRPEAPRLAELLELLTPAATAGLVDAAAALEPGRARKLLLEAVARTGEKNPEPVHRALGGPKADFVRELIALVAAWGRPAGVGPLAGCVRHPDARVRLDAVAALEKLQPEGDGVPFVEFVFDADRTVRLRALNCLTRGRHRVPFAAWQAPVQRDELHELPAGDKRALFHAVRLSCGDEAVPWWRTLLGDRGWRNRQKKEETALMAVDALRWLATPAAVAALEEGRARGGAVRQACADALAQVAGSGRGGAP